MSKPTKYITLDHSSGLSKLFVDHVTSLGNYDKIGADIEKIGNAKKDFSHRKTLVETLLNQYKESGIEVTGLLKDNIHALHNENAFTVTTGHQLCVFSGPLYVIHKIISAVHTCNELNRINKNNKFVPVYWMATEDHDIEEISYVNIFREKFKVEFSSTGSTGNLNSGDVVKQISQLKELAGDLPFAKEILNIINDCYRDGVLLKHAHRKFIHALFEQLGVVIIDGDAPAFKKIVTDIFGNELNNQVVYNTVTQQNSLLLEKGYSVQVNPRELNLFLLEKNSRSRIEKDGGGFKLVDSNQTISKPEMDEILQKHPEKISPNVLLRPLYQCTILPDVAMVGGPAEIAYWRQLDGLFEVHNVPMPLLLPRMFAFYLNDKQYDVLTEIEKEKLNVFGNESSWTSAWVKKGTSYVSFEDEKKELERLFQILNEKATAVDKSLTGFVASEKSKSEKFIVALDEKIVRSLKKNSENELNALKQLHVKLFPEGSWQERHESALPYLWRYGKDFITQVLKEIPPFVNQCAILNK